MPRLVVVLPLVPLAQGDAWALNDWPLHVTVAPTFETGSAPAEIGEVLDSLLTQHPEIRVLADQDAGFGRAQDIPVTVLSPSPALDHLHRALIAGLTAVPVAFDDPDFIGDGYARTSRRSATPPQCPASCSNLVRLRSWTWHHSAMPACVVWSGRDCSPAESTALAATARAQRGRAAV